MNRITFLRAAFLACAVSFSSNSLVFAQKGKPDSGGGGGGTSPTGTIFFDRAEYGLWAMNPDGTGKTLVLPAVPPGHLLNAEGTEPVFLSGSPCDQVYGNDPKLDRWFLRSVHTGTYDKLYRDDGTEYVPSDPHFLRHHDIFAYRTNPTNRSEFIVVQLTNLFGYVWTESGLPAEWSNDSNASETTSYIGSWTRDIRGCFYIDNDGNNVIDYRLDPSQSYSVKRRLDGLKLPFTASMIQLSWELGIDIAYRPASEEELDEIVQYAAGDTGWASPAGDQYVIAESGQLVIRRLVDGSFVRTIWNGTAGVQPVGPVNAVWSRDGSTIAFNNGGNQTRSNSGGIWTMPASGGKPVQLVQNSAKGFNYKEHFNHTFSPQSNFLGFRVIEMTSQGKTGDILRIPVTGGTVTNLTGDVSYFAGVRRWVSNTIDAP